MLCENKRFIIFSVLYGGYLCHGAGAPVIRQVVLCSPFKHTLCAALGSCNGTFLHGRKISEGELFGSWHLG